LKAIALLALGSTLAGVMEIGLGSCELCRVLHAFESPAFFIIVRVLLLSASFWLDRL
jgi:hypothetical protein